MNKTYKLTLSETFDGVTNEYYKVVLTSVEEAKMPEYVKNADANDETIILVGDVDNLRASTSINEDGDIEIDTDMPRYTQVKACEFSSYVNNLPSNKLYRLYTRDSSDNRYFGFISTRGDINGIFMPSITTCTWERFNAPAANSSVSAFTAEQILNGATTPIQTYRDYEFMFSPAEDRDYEVFKFVVPEEHDSNNVYDIRVYANDNVTLELWTQHNGVMKYRSSEDDRNGFIGIDTTLTFYIGNNQYETLDGGDTLYMVVHFAYPINLGEGFISLQCEDDTDDVTGSAYEAYTQWENGNYTQYTSYTPFYITNDRDADVFFLNCGTSSVKNYVRLKSIHQEDKELYDNKYTARKKLVELAYTPANATVFRTYTSPEDIMELPNGGELLSITTTSTTTNKKFVYIYNAAYDSTDPVDKKDVKNDIYLLKRYNK